MIKTKVAFLEGRLFSSQSELFEYFLNCSDWLDKSRPSKKATFVLITTKKWVVLLFNFTRPKNGLCCYLTLHGWINAKCRSVLKWKSLFSQPVSQSYFQLE